jgi:hypothetical protein
LSSRGEEELGISLKKRAVYDIPMANFPEEELERQIKEKEGK